MRVHISKIRELLGRSDKAFKKAFWKELEGFRLVHIQRGDGTITHVDGTSVHVAHGDDLRTYSAPVLHSYINDLPEIPDNSIASAAISFERNVAQLGAEWADWEIDWRELWDTAGTIIALLEGWKANQSFSGPDVYRARSIGVGHIVPLSHELIAEQDPWNYVKAASQ